MPTYEYLCLGECDLVFEIEQRIVDPELTACPSCGGKVERQISRTTFALKGSGWFKDGYSSKGAK